MTEVWEEPLIRLERDVTENEIGWPAVAVGGIVAVGVGFLYCDIRYGKSFGVDISWDGWRPANIRAGCL